MQAPRKRPSLFDKAFFIQLDFRRKPTGAGLGADHGENRAYFEGATPPRFHIFQLNGLQTFVAGPLPQAFPATDLPRGTETILLVEDDAALRRMATSLLVRLGYTVLTAANGAEAVTLQEIHGDTSIDLLFTDVVMPHMNGKELSERVLALSPNTKILFTSAYTENAIVHQGVLDKGVALLQKPFTPSALAHKLREVLGEPNRQEQDSNSVQQILL